MRGRNAICDLSLKVSSENRHFYRGKYHSLWRNSQLMRGCCAPAIVGTCRPTFRRQRWKVDIYFHVLKNGCEETWCASPRKPGASLAASATANLGPRQSGEGILSPLLDIVRFCPIWHDKLAKPHDTRTIFYDSRPKTYDFRPNSNDKRDRCLIYIASHKPQISLESVELSADFGRLSCRFASKSRAFATISCGIGQYRTKASKP
jgi:hypothetical protein